jgi:prepilin-type N-terminal cleavage/methylation domain-containing protein
LEKIHIALRKQSIGFTLAELLIALAILGEIATFTLPKIISAQQNAKQLAVIKETVATLSEVLYVGTQFGEIDDSNFDTYMLSKVNAVKLCPNNVRDDGCMPQDLPYTTFPTYKGFILPNGAAVACGRAPTTPSGAGECLIDWNGTDGPNLKHNDQLDVNLVYNSNGISKGKVGQVKNNTAWTTDDEWAAFFQ